MPNDEMRAIGLRFNNVNIPQGAMITSAELEFHALEDNQDRDALWRIRIDQDRQAEPWQDMPADLSTRELGDAVSWQPTLWDEDEQYQSPDLTKIIQPLVDRQTWCGGKPINIVIEGYGRRAIAGYDHDPAKAATLKISYDSSNIPHGQGCMAKSIVSRISNGNDDSFEAHDGFVGPGSKRISLFSYRARAHITGLRFVDVILGEATDFAERFWRSREDLSRRLTTEASVDWTDLPMDLAANDKIRTPNIGSIVQEIVDRPRWQSGNALAFLLKRKGAGMGRHAMKSYNGEPTAAPKLMIRYQAPVSPMSTLAEFITPRELVTKNVNAIQPAGNTPIVDTLYEASRPIPARAIELHTHCRTSEGNLSDRLLAQN